MQLTLPGFFPGCLSLFPCDGMGARLHVYMLPDCRHHKRLGGKEELDINLITLDFLEQFKAFLIRERDARTKKLMQQGKRVPSNRSLSLYLISIKKLFKEAQKKYNKKEKNLILIPNSPFVDFEIPKQEATRKRAISADIIKKVWKLPYKDMKKGYKSTCRYNLAKDCFILSFCLMGINSADLYNATEMRGNTIIYNRTTKIHLFYNTQLRTSDKLYQMYNFRTRRNLFFNTTQLQRERADAADSERKRVFYRTLYERCDRTEFLHP